MGSPFADRWDWIDDEIRHRTRRVGLWLDTTGLNPDQTADTIVRRMDEASTPTGRAGARMASG